MSAALAHPVYEGGVTNGHAANGDAEPKSKKPVAPPAAKEPEQQQPAAQEEEPEVDIVINNVVCSFNVRCHLNLRVIATQGLNVEYRKENGVSISSSSS